MDADDYNELVFIDTETTGLDPMRHTVWEVALIAGGEEFSAILPLTPQAMADANPISLEIGGYHRRVKTDVNSLDEREIQKDRRWAAMMVDAFTTGKHLVGANPAFDAAFLKGLLREAGLESKWHYHLLDIEPLMIGVLADRGIEVPIPWKSTELSEMLGVPGPSEEERHTALGDARWCKRVVESVFGFHLGVSI